MARKGLNIYKRKDGRWEGRYRVYINSIVGLKYFSIYGKSHAEAREKLLLRMAENKAPAKKCSLTVKNLFELWLTDSEGKLKDSTRANYIYKLNKYIYPAFGSVKYEKINVSLVNHFISERLRSGLSEKYTKDIVSLLKALGKYAFKVHKYADFFTDEVLPVKPKTKEIVCYTRAEKLKFISCANKDTDLTKLGFLLSYYTGVRIGELAALRWADIDLEGGTIHVRRTLQRIYDFDNSVGGEKTKVVITDPKSQKSNRIIPIPSFLSEFLLKHKAEKACFVLSGSESYVEPRCLSYRFKAFLKKEKLPSISFHTLRHMFATNCMELNFDMKSLSELLGHSGVEITIGRYVHSSFAHKQGLMARHTLAF